jgi:hypothetical protein
MGNMVMNAGLVEETALGLGICYLTVLQGPFFSSSVAPLDLCWAMPFSCAALHATLPRPRQTPHRRPRVPEPTWSARWR